MPKATTPDVRIARRAARRHGVFTRAQALKAGFTERCVQLRVQSGRWEALYSGVYRICGAPDTLEQRVMAACLAAGPLAFACGLLAGALYNLDGIRWSEPAIGMPHGWRSKHSGLPTKQLRHLIRSDLTKIGVIPITSPVRTLIDLASIVDRRRLEAALDDAVRRGLVTLARLSRRIAELPAKGRPGLRLLKELIDIRLPLPMVPRSALESRMLWVLHQSGLPKAEMQVPVVRMNGRTAYVDYVYSEAKIAIEVDGKLWHSGTLAEQRDGIRARDLERLGWTIIRISSEDLDHDPVEVCRRIARALGVKLSASGARKLRLA